ncbi:MAG: VanZ family protein [Candidatus Sedimenticola sp. 20ELBAFRAG]
MKLPGEPKHYLVAALLWMGVITLFSHQPGSSIRTVTWLSPQMTDLLHIPSYAMLTFLAWMGTREKFPGFATAVTGVLLGILAFALLDEWHQSFIPGRTQSLSDIVNDLIGASVALMAIKHFNVRTA